MCGNYNRNSYNVFRRITVDQKEYNIDYSELTTKISELNNIQDNIYRIEGEMLTDALCKQQILINEALISIISLLLETMMKESVNVHMEQKQIIEMVQALARTIPSITV